MGEVRGIRGTQRRARPVGRAAVVAGVVLALATASLGVDSAAAAKQKSKPVTLATLKILADGITVKHGGATKYVAAKEGEVLAQGDSILTNKTGRAEIDYTDGSLTRLSTSTEFTITKLTDKRGGRQTQGTLSVGETWNRAAKVSENGSFEVKAGGTTAAVEGTAFVFSCAKTTRATKKRKRAKRRTCQVISVVDTVSVETDNIDATLPPGTAVVVTNDVAGGTSTVTYDDFIKNPFIVDNLNLDEKAGKGGLYEITPPAPPTTTTTTTTTTQPPRPVQTAPPPPPDVTAPSITLSTPPQGAVYTKNQVVNASFSCTEEAGGSGLANCVASTANGGAIDTSTVGAHTYTVTASDNAGNTAFVTHTYTVTG